MDMGMIQLCLVVALNAAFMIGWRWIERNQE